MFFILNVLGDQISHFLEFFYYLLSHFENRWSNSGLTKQWNHWISDFQSGLINSKKNPKNIKFGLQAYFIYISNGLDRLFGFWKFKQLIRTAQHVLILKCAWRPNFIFFGICLLFIKPLWKSLIRWSINFYYFLLFTVDQQFSK